MIRFGFVSVSKIDNYFATCKYITKYITKNFYDSTKFQRLYFCSQGLKRSQITADFVINSNIQLAYDYKSEFCKIKNLTMEESQDFYNNFLLKYGYCNLKGG